MILLASASSGKVLTASVRLDTKSAERSLRNLEKKINKINRAINSNVVASNRANTAMTRNFKDTGKAVDSLTKKIGKLAKAYLGIMGARAVVTTSDIITSAENRLNNLDGGNAKATQQAMDKMFASSQNARTGYAEMMSNVSKSMTLAGDAFQDNIDNAIRFQEIMAKSYSIGGASAAEQSSSMYQLIQALGSGILQGDELRSVREGAPIAYKEIEKFAQGVYNTEESLKDLASQGMITSEIVVAAMLNVGDEIDKKFENTQMTFAQAFTSIKNTAIKSFKPVLQMLNKALNSDFGKSVISGIGYSLQFVASILTVVFNLVGNIYNFIANNWGAISKILLTLATIKAVSLIPKLVTWFSLLGTIIARYIYLGVCAMQSAIKTAAAWAIANWQMLLIITVLAAIVIAIIWVSDSFVDACGIIVGSIYWVLGVIHNIVAWILNTLAMLFSVIVTSTCNIAVAFNNAWQSAKVSFWEWVQDCLNGTSLIGKAVSKIAELFGLDSVSIDSKINEANGKMLEYLDTGAYAENAYSLLGYTTLDEMYNKGYDKGSNIGNWITDKLNFGSLLGDYNLGDTYDMNKALEGIEGNTDKIAGSMDLTQEDLEYLRRVADMEWKKEFTTATIKVDMTNNNTLNNETDLDGIVTKLADKLYEELDSVANGVYS